MMGFRSDMRAPLQAAGPQKGGPGSSGVLAWHPGEGQTLRAGLARVSRPRERALPAQSLSRPPMRLFFAISSRPTSQ
jgi:hypothetical protein